MYIINLAVFVYANVVNTCRALTIYLLRTHTHTHTHMRELVDLSFVASAVGFVVQPNIELRVCTRTT